MRPADDAEVRRLAIALCESRNEGDQNHYRRKLGILLCGWPDLPAQEVPLVDIHEQITAICNMLGIDSKYVLQLNIRPDRAEVVLARGKDGRCKGAKYIDETASLATERVEFKVRA